MLATKQQQSLFAALADPTRRELLAQLAAHSPKTATELARDYPITRQGLRKHLALLQVAGLVTVDQAGRDKRYSLSPAPLSELDQWVRAITLTWDLRLARLKFMLENEK